EEKSAQFSARSTHKGHSLVVFARSGIRFSRKSSGTVSAQPDGTLASSVGHFEGTYGRRRETLATFWNYAGRGSVGACHNPRDLAGRITIAVMSVTAIVTTGQQQSSSHLHPTRCSHSTYRRWNS